MSKWEDFEQVALANSSRRDRCIVGRFLDSLDKDDRDTVNRVIHNGKINSSYLHRSIKERSQAGDIVPSAETIRKHRLSVCMCNKGEE